MGRGSGWASRAGLLVGLFRRRGIIELGEDFYRGEDLCTGDPSLRLKNGSGQDDNNLLHCWDHEEENKSERPGTSGRWTAGGGCPQMGLGDAGGGVVRGARHHCVEE